MHNQVEPKENWKRKWYEGRDTSAFINFFGRFFNFQVQYVPNPYKVRQAAASSVAANREIQHSQPSLGGAQQLIDFERNSQDEDIVASSAINPIQQRAENDLQAINLPELIHDMDNPEVMMNVIMEVSQLLKTHIESVRAQDIPKVMMEASQRFQTFIDRLRDEGNVESQRGAGVLIKTFIQIMENFGHLIAVSEEPVRHSIFDQLRELREYGEQQITEIRAAIADMTLRNSVSENRINSLEESVRSILAQLRQLREYGEQQITDIQTSIAHMTQGNSVSENRINALEESLVQTNQGIKALMEENKALRDRNTQLDGRIQNLERSQLEHPQPQAAQPKQVSQDNGQARIEELETTVQALKEDVARLQAQTPKELPTYEKDFDKNHKILFRPEQNGILVSILKTTNGAVLGAKEVHDFLSYHTQRTPEFLNELFESREHVAPGFLAQHGLFAQAEQVTQWHAPRAMAV